MTQDRLILGEERRLVTVLFADLVGYTSISESRDPEVIQEALSLCFERLASEIQRYGGYAWRLYLRRSGRRPLPRQGAAERDEERPQPAPEADQPQHER